MATLEDPVVIAASRDTALLVARADVDSLEDGLGPPALVYSRETGTLSKEARLLHVHLKFLYDMELVDPPQTLEEWVGSSKP